MTTPLDAPDVIAERAHLVDHLEEALGAAPDGPLARRDVPRELIVPSTPRDLVRMTLEEWAMLAFLWGVLVTAPWWIDGVAILLIAGRYHALGVILHDAAHMPMRAKSLAIRVVEVLCGYPMATTLNAMRYHHLRHHRDSGMETDPYFKGGRQTAHWWIVNVGRGALLVPFWTVRAVVGAIALLVPSLRTPYGRVFLQDRTRADLRDSRELIDCARAELGQLVFQAGIVAALVRWPGAMLVGYVVPMTIAAVLAAYRLLIEHAYERTADRRVETIIATTNDNYLGAIGAWVLAPRNIGHHIVHHLHPQAGIAALPKLRAWYTRQHPAVYPVARR